MPTRKRRIGFIPRSEVLVLINRLSDQSNLSNSKIINILVEEALYRRGIFNITTGKIINNRDNFNNENLVKSEKGQKEFIYNLNNNVLKDENLLINDRKYEALDKEIYAKFLMFLQFQEKMREGDL